MKFITKTLGGAVLLACLGGVEASAQTQAEETRATRSRFQVGGYAEVAYTRNFYSDNVYKYQPSHVKSDRKNHGRFDIPHAVVYLSYDFGKGWKMGSEIEFEHGGSGAAYEKETEEGGEWEQETEKGGEVELEQLWIQKTFWPELNVKIGHIVVPIGLTNAHHEPTEYFTVYRPEGEATIFPCTWHQTGVSLWGRHGAWRYEAQFLAGLDALQFSAANWIQGGTKSPYEFDVANKYAVAARVDNYSVPGLRLGLSAYYGHSINNTYETMTGSHYQVKGAVAIGSFDFHYDAHNWVVRGSLDYGHLSDADHINAINVNQPTNSPNARSHVGDQAVAFGVEAGYDFFSQIKKLREKAQRMYLFARYEYYDSYRPATGATTDYPYTEKHRLAVGLNYYPIPEVVIKGEFSHRFLHSQYNDEPSVSLGVAYAGFFTK